MSLKRALRAGSVLVSWLVLSGCGGSSLSSRESAAGSAPLSSAESFLRLPAATRAQVSPDGRRIAGLAAREGVQVVFEMPAGGGKVNFLSKIDPETVVRAFGWPGNGVLLVGYEQPVGRTEQESEMRRAAPDSVIV